MVKSREWSKKSREEVISFHKQGFIYKKIVKTLNISRDTIGSIICKFKAKGRVETLPGRSRKRMLSNCDRTCQREVLRFWPRRKGAHCEMKASMPELLGAPPCWLQSTRRVCQKPHGQATTDLGYCSLEWRDEIGTLWAYGSMICLEEEERGL